MANRIFITGDCHGNIDLSKLSSSFFPLGKELDKEDYVIVCGDMGIVWDNSGQDKWYQKWYKNKPWTTLFVDGNHENHELLASYPVEEWHGGKVHKINDSLIHLMRGQIFDICGKKIFTMGGATSIDKMYRIEGVSWWPQELPSDEEYNEALDNLEAVGNKVDIILSHCAPDELIEILYYKDNQKDKLTNFLNVIANTVEYKDWYLGHYHVDKDFGKFHILYYNVVEI